MTSVHRQSRVAHSCQQMFELVAAVEDYPEFLRWCSKARLEEDTPTSQLAHVTVHLPGLDTEVITRNTLSRPERMDIALVKGPFKSMTGSWQFIGGDDGDEGCEIHLNLDVEFANPFLGFTLGGLLPMLADRMMADFRDRATAIWGQP